MSFRKSSKVGEWTAARLVLSKISVRPYSGLSLVFRYLDTNQGKTTAF